VTRLAVLRYPDPRLRTRAAPVTQFDAGLARLIDDLLETMYAERGLGLAATQVDVHQQILAMDVSPNKNAPQVFINPEVVLRSAPGRVEESCLSVPGVSDLVTRSTRITVRTADRFGVTSLVKLEGLAAVCLEHEMDHLAGVLLIDHLSLWKRLLLRLTRRAAPRFDPTTSTAGAI
jgi:peptide deformylase